MGLERGSAGLGDCVGGQGERRGNWEGMGGLLARPLGLTVGVLLCAGELSPLQSLMGLLLLDLGMSLVGLSTTFRLPFCSNLSPKCRSPREWERFQNPVGCWGPSRSSQLRLAAMVDCLWALRSPSRLKPFSEGLKKLLGNFVRWFLPFCCRASVEIVMGNVG